MSETAFVCVACGTQFAPTAHHPERCPICEDERQFVPPGGQTWTTLDRLMTTHRNVFQLREPGLFEIETTPHFAIGQRAFLIRRPEGNVLWDCLALLDEATVAIVQALGGLRAIAVSHPHFYTTVVEWSRAFGGTPIYLHEDDRAWAMRPDPAIRFWRDDRLDLGEGMTLVRTGGHFDGGTVFHWPGGAGGRGVLLSGDLIHVTPASGRVSFMRSYPNLIPLPAAAVRRIGAVLEPFAFERVYGAFRGGNVEAGGKGVLTRSVARYVRAIGG